MPILPSDIMAILNHFAPVFSERIWDWVPVLVGGAILAPQRRMVSTVLRVMGLGQERHYQNYHRVLNRASWSSLAVSQILLGLLVAAFVAAGAPVVVAADETLERRRGAKIHGLGCFRDAARSTGRNKVKSFGLRWVSMMLLVAVPWSPRVWALPFLTVLAPNQASDATRGVRHKTSIDWVKQMILQVRRWLPERPLVLVVDGGLAALKLGLRCAQLRQPVTYLTRLQLNARLFDLPPAQPAGKRGRPRLVGDRQPKPQDWLENPDTAWQSIQLRLYQGRQVTLEYVSQVALWYTCGVQPLLGRWVVLHDPSGALKPWVLFATDPNLSPEQIITFYLMRWSQEVTFEEVRAHLGFETHRQGSRLAVQRTSPAVLGLFALVTLLAHHLLHNEPFPVHSTAWYTKSFATFSDVLAFVRTHLWLHTHFPRAASPPGSVIIPPDLLQLWLETLAFAA